jgi:hypothetical protein
MMAFNMDDRHNLALSGTLEAVFTASTHEEQASSMFSTLTWRVFSGLSHLQDTRIVGNREAVKPSKESAGSLNAIL